MNRKKRLITGLGLTLGFALWTVLVATVDKGAIGPLGSSVGFSTLNGTVHRLIGVNMTLYTITDILGLVPIFTALGFAILGLCQWIKRKSIAKVDRSIIILGLFYVAVMAIYVTFEYVIINYRPVLIEGNLEVSYPSSTTMLVATVMPTTVMQFNKLIRNSVVRRAVGCLIITFSAFMIVGRILAGVHWISDIIGGGLISSGLVVIYSALNRQ
jgi:undecaprenyl-diphosphatase